MSQGSEGVTAKAVTQAKPMDHRDEEPDAVQRPERQR